MSTFDTQAREDSISCQNQEHEQLKSPTDLERNRQMQLTLHDLQRTMDPMIAASVYNNHYSPLTSLPEPILERLLTACIGTDAVSAHCLGRVCRKLRHLIHSPRIWTSVMHSDVAYADDGSDLLGKAIERLRRCIQRDGMCRACKPWFALPAEVFTKWFNNMSSLEGRDRPNPVIHCKFDSETEPTIHCGDCGTHHDMQAFSPYYHDMEWRPRCLGRQGGVQLCEHKHVFWVDIENHINHWRAQSEAKDYWDKCIADFLIECQDPSHDARCTPDGSPTWPRARLMTEQAHPNEVLLRLEWQPHSGPNAFNLTPYGRIPAHEARALFKRHKEGAAGILCPSRAPQNHSPAMMCFDPRVCSCLEYKGAVAPDGIHRSPLGPDLQPDNCRWDHGYRKCHNVILGRRGGYTGIYATPHRPTEDSMCVMTIYWTDVSICSKTDDKINPDHGWFHAMDPDTYDRPFPSTELLCKDENCLNYYRRPRSLPCASEGHRPCDCFWV